jgi:glycosyltransferase involved in cell wall biosynthesis
MQPLLEKLTIAIPLYNDEKYIRGTIESCLGEAAHIVIYDNCSTDGSSAIAAEFAAKYPHVRHVRHAENVGAFENFRRGLAECTTEYFSWVGSHDVLTEGYAAKVISEMEKDPAVALGGGTIVQIGEHGEQVGVTRSEWANESKEGSTLDRTGACALGLRKDCSIFYGIYRTALLRNAWFNTPCLGFDRAMLVRTAAEGKIIYVPEAVFKARNLDKSRNSKTDRERRAAVVGRAQDKPLAKNLFTRNMMMVQTVLAQAKTPEDLTLALRIVDKINRRYQNRRYYQKLRLVKIAGAAAVVALIVVALAR